MDSIGRARMLGEMDAFLRAHDATTASTSFAERVARGLNAVDSEEDLPPGVGPARGVPPGALQRLKTLRAALIGPADGADTGYLGTLEAAVTPTPLNA